MQVLTIAEMRAVLAHEFGHYYGGDTRLAPWIYKTREAILRTVGHLSRRGSILQFPFVFYARLFMRVTQAISRAQEYAADALAARTVGGGRSSAACDAPSAWRLPMTPTGARSWCLP
jgi:Zn-dependent protease with chaperone function